MVCCDQFSGSDRVTVFLIGNEPSDRMGAMKSGLMMSTGHSGLRLVQSIDASELQNLRWSR